MSPPRCAHKRCSVISVLLLLLLLLSCKPGPELHVWQDPDDLEQEKKIQRLETQKQAEEMILCLQKSTKLGFKPAENWTKH